MKFITKTLAVLLTLFIVWAAGFAVFTAMTLSARPNKSGTADVIVVLTGGDQRVQTGLGLLAAGRAPYLFISGVHKDVTREEIIQLWKEATILPPCCIELGRNAHTTSENAEETKDWMKDKNFKSIYLVTANYHIIRAMMEFSRILPDVKITAYPVMLSTPTAGESRFWVLMLKEYHKTVFRWLSLQAEKGGS